MRPVDQKNAAAHPLYDGTFSQAAAGEQLVPIYERMANDATGNDPVYTFFRNGLNFAGLNALAGGIAPPGVAVPNGGAQPDPPPAAAGQMLRPAIPGVMARVAGTAAYRQTYQAPARVFGGLPNRTNTGNVSITGFIQQVVRFTNHANPQRWERIWLLLRPNEAAELVRVWKEFGWNGGAAPAVIGNLTVPQFTTLINDIGLRLLKRKTVPEGIRGPYLSYKGAKAELLDHLGGYCSYCESKLQDGANLDVEHRLPKSYFSTEGLRWDNFLLGCVLCNREIKSQRPSRIFGITNALAANHPGIVPPAPVTDAAPPIGGGALLPYHEIRQACEDFELWPDANDGGALTAGDAAALQLPFPAPVLNLSLRMVRYQLFGAPAPAVGAAVPALVPIGMRDATWLDNERVTIRPGQQFEADVWNTAAGGLVRCIVEVRPLLRNLNYGTAAFQARKHAATTNMIGLVGLDRPSTADRDQRTIGRTGAWFRAIRSLRRLQFQIRMINWWQQVPRFSNLLNYAPAGWGALTNDQWEQICDDIETGGFYSVWITVFREHSHVLAQDLARRLAARGVAQPNARDRYHGTDPATSVVPFIPLM